MRLRFWIGLLCVALIAGGSVAAAILVRDNDNADFQQMQKDDAVRAAHQAESMAQLAVGGYVSWFNHEPLHESLADVSPVEFEDLYVRRGSNRATSI